MGSLEIHDVAVDMQSSNDCSFDGVAEAPQMRLSTYITTHLDQILSDWLAFVQTRALPRPDLDILVLRDHADEMLTAIAKDLERPISEGTAKTESRGLDDAGAPSAEPAAHLHGALRAQYGFSLQQMVSEFRALRGTVLRGWLTTVDGITNESLRELIRFDGAIQQTLTASVSRYMEEQDHAKEMFLGMLSHDLKAPLSTIIAASGFVLEAEELSDSGRSMMERIKRSARRMNRMVGDLLDFTRIRLGSGIPITRENINLERVLRETVDETQTAYPDKQIHLHATGSLHARVDSGRIHQALSNLIRNAVQHGAVNEPIEVTARGDEKEVKILVHNEGKPIPSEQIGRLFTPFDRPLTKGSDDHDPRHLGLGLYITKSIIAAHGGQIGVDSSADSGTTITIRLPRDGSSPS